MPAESPGSVALWMSQAAWSRLVLSFRFEHKKYMCVYKKVIITSKQANSDKGINVQFDQDISEKKEMIDFMTGIQTL